MHEIISIYLVLADVLNEKQNNIAASALPSCLISGSADRSPTWSCCPLWYTSVTPHHAPKIKYKQNTECVFTEEIHSVHVTLSAGGKQRHIFKVWESLKLFLFCFTLDYEEVNIGQSEIGCAVSNLQARQTLLYLLHTCVATRQLLPEVGDVMVVLLQVLLEVVAPERQQGFFYLGVELWKQVSQLLVGD